MFTPWIKRKSLKRATRGRSLVTEGVPPNLIVLVSVAALVVLVGALAVAYGHAAPSPTPVAAPSGTPTPSLTPTATPYSGSSGYSGYGN